MNTKHLDYIRIISETGSLSDAADILGITQPVLSRYIARLERNLGVRIFIKTETGYVLTEPGYIYLDSVNKIRELQTGTFTSSDLYINTSIYKYLLSAAKYGNISQAARECYISQPTLTWHIKNIERKLGFPLFIRQKRTIVPSDKGYEFLHNAEKIVNTEENALRQIEKYKSDNLMNYRIFTDYHLRDPIINQVIPIFRKQYPDLNISVIASDTDIGIEMLSQDQVQVGVFPIVRPVPPGIKSIDVGRNEFKLVLSDRHPANRYFKKSGVNINALKNENFIFDSRYSMISTIQKQILADNSFAPSTESHVHLMLTIADKVSAGDGISILPDYMIRLAEAPLASYSLPEPYELMHVLAYPESSQMLGYHKALARLVRKLFSS